MGGIRQYMPHDVPEVLALHERSMPVSGPTAASVDYHKLFYGDMLFDHPWLVDDLPSLVYEHDGSVVGFLAVVPRPMTFGSRPIRAAVSVRFMVDPGHPAAALAAAALHRRFLRGPQDLSLIENANDAARRVWAGTPGVVVVPMGSISWSVPGTLEPLRRAEERALVPSELLDCIRSSAEPFALQPIYDESTLRWLTTFLEAARYRGVLHSRAVLDHRGARCGWYVYYANPEGYNGVIALRAAPGETGRTLRGLLHHAAINGGSSRTVGRLQPDLLCPIADHGGTVVPGPWTFAYSADPRIARALTTDDAFLTRLDGEFC